MASVSGGSERGGSSYGVDSTDLSTKNLYGALKFLSERGVLQETLEEMTPEQRATTLLVLATIQEHGTLDRHDENPLITAARRQDLWQRVQKAPPKRGALSKLISMFKNLFSTGPSIRQLQNEFQVTEKALKLHRSFAEHNATLDRFDKAGGPSVMKFKEDLAREMVTFAEKMQKQSSHGASTIAGWIEERISMLRQQQDNLKRTDPQRELKSNYIQEEIVLLQGLQEAAAGSGIDEAVKEGYMKLLNGFLIHNRGVIDQAQADQKLYAQAQAQGRVARDGLNKFLSKHPLHELARPLESYVWATPLFDRGASRDEFIKAFQRQHNIERGLQKVAELEESIAYLKAALPLHQKFALTMAALGGLSKDLSKAFFNNNISYFRGKLSELESAGADRQMVEDCEKFITQLEDLRGFPDAGWEKEAEHVIEFWQNNVVAINKRIADAEAQLQTEMSKLTSLGVHPEQMHEAWQQEQVRNIKQDLTIYMRVPPKEALRLLNERIESIERQMDALNRDTETGRLQYGFFKVALEWLQALQPDVAAAAAAVEQGSFGEAKLYADLYRMARDNPNDTEDDPLARRVLVMFGKMEDEVARLLPLEGNAGDRQQLLALRESLEEKGRIILDLETSQAVIQQIDDWAAPFISLVNLNDKIQATIDQFSRGEELPWQVQ